MKNSKEKSSVKRWEAMFHVIPQPDSGTVDHQYVYRARWMVCLKGTMNQATARFYSQKKDAERGAAQIYNHIEKSLLGQS